MHFFGLWCFLGFSFSEKDIQKTSKSKIIARRPYENIVNNH